MEITQEIRDLVTGSAEEETPVTEVLEETPEEELEEGELEGEEELLEGEGDFEYLNEVLESSGWDVSDFYQLKRKDPDSGDVMTLQDKIDQGTVARREADTLKQQYDQLNGQMRQMQQMSQAGQQQDAELKRLDMQLGAIDMYFQSPDLAALKQNDPAQAGLKMQEAEQARHNIQAKKQQHEGQMQQRTDYMRQDQLQQGARYLTEHIPEWKDPAVKQAEQAEIASAFSQAGYSQGDVANLTDPRAVMLVRELVALRKTIAGGKEAAQVVRQSPRRSLKTGRYVKKTNVNRVVDRAKHTRNKGDILAAARALTGARK